MTNASSPVSQNPLSRENWSLTSLQQRLAKTGGRLFKHPRCYWLLLAEGHLNRRRFDAAEHSDAAGARRIVEAVAAEKSVQKR
jgi:hypothetical protein